MAIDVFIQSYDTVETFGVYLLDGGLSVLEQPPKPRIPFFNEWEDTSGRDYDENDSLVYEPQTLEVPFLMVGENMADYREKRRDFLDLISEPFDMQVLEWGESYKLRLIEISDWQLLNESLTGETSASFVLKLENNHVLPTYVFRYLADNKGRHIIINDNKRILVKTKYHA
ncbi:MULTISPECIES: hypothetical protein [Sphingobacterium]|uniref:hypothetical protein n=1 Tax=Sphingobacterium TaxID=28453 RepID=UPI0025805828|nr:MULTISPECIES: hypothetical protein [Sphingobacterium]